MWQLLRTWFLFILVAAVLVLFLWLYETNQQRATQAEPPLLQSEAASNDNPTVATTPDRIPEKAAPDALESPSTEQRSTDSADASAELEEGAESHAPLPVTQAVPPQATAIPTEPTSPAKPLSVLGEGYALARYPDLSLCPIFSPLDPNTQLTQEPNSQTLFFLLPIGEESVVHALFPATVAAIQTRDHAYDLYLIDHARGLCLFYGGLSRLQPGVALNAPIPCGAAVGQMLPQGKENRLQLRLSHYETADWTQGRVLNLMAFLGIK